MPVASGPLCKSPSAHRVTTPLHQVLPLGVFCRRSNSYVGTRSRAVQHILRSLQNLSDTITKINFITKMSLWSIVPFESTSWIIPWAHSCHTQHMSDHNFQHHHFYRQSLILSFALDLMSCLRCKWLVEKLFLVQCEKEVWLVAKVVIQK